MKTISRYIGTIIFLMLSGCTVISHLDFGEEEVNGTDNKTKMVKKGLHYYDPVPYLFVSTTPECVSTSSIITLPGKENTVKFMSGILGTAKLTVDLENGMIKSVGQETDTKIPETINALANLGTTVSTFAKKDGPPNNEQTIKIVCTPTAILYPIINGIPDMNNPITAKVSYKEIPISTQKPQNSTINKSR